MKGSMVALFLLLLLAGGPGAEAEELNCGEALACLLGCPSGNSECAQNCAQGLHPKAQDLYFVFLTCVIPKCPGSPPSAVCVLQAGLGPCKSS